MNQGAAAAELSPRAIGIGLALAAVLGAANVYLGLKVGMTVSASIPAAVVAMLLLRKGAAGRSMLEAEPGPDRRLGGRVAGRRDPLHRAGAGADRGLEGFRVLGDDADRGRRWLARRAVHDSDAHASSSRRAPSCPIRRAWPARRCWRRAADDAESGAGTARSSSGRAPRVRRSSWLQLVRGGIHGSLEGALASGAGRPLFIWAPTSRRRSSPSAS